MPEKTKFFFLALFLASAASGLFFMGRAEMNSRSDSAEKPQKNGYKYMGAAVCMTCHAKEKLGNQSLAWTGSSHARSYLQLRTGRSEMLEKEAKGMVKVGYGRDIAQEAMRLGMGADCLKCHAKGAELDKSLLEPTFHIEDGVQCESCHGPGSEYVAIMRAKWQGGKWARGQTEKRRKLPPEVRPKMPTKKGCMACHREKPTHAVLKSKPFDFEKAWKQIAHPIPER
ncbi:MAG TPA: hypothetical protein EYP19_15795 [Desulfobacterales bacterium]|nr:hypothetical protein [Desulfobacterales bacterium]